MAASKLSVMRASVETFVDNHIAALEASAAQPGKGGRKKSVLVADAIVPVPEPDGALVPAPKAKSKSQPIARMYKCKTCGVSFKAASNSRALQHLLLTKNPEVRHCTNPQVTKEEMERLQRAGVEQALSYMERLDAHMQLKMITVTQPTLRDSVSVAEAMSAAELRELQKQQARSAISKGGFAVNKELDEGCTKFLQQLKPNYTPPSKGEVKQLRDELRQEYQRRQLVSSSPHIVKLCLV